MILHAYCWISAWVDTALTRPADRERGQGLAEYALILALIAVLAILALVFLGSQIRTILSRVGTSI
ncbi:MAG TPA: Flp family type IVb pilin [Candidatus Dormibacteraeota bacterium]|jgi:Flp pilus assembly pilin Flp|nr:Flp family type IVb pilin [Candidatus Dormibacteraeota bacterium]